MGGNASVLGGRLPGLGAADIRQILEALNELGGTETMSVITLTADPTVTATAAAMGQLGTYGGDLFIHGTGAADTKWLNITALSDPQVQAKLASLVLEETALTALAPLGTLATQLHDLVVGVRPGSTPQLAIADVYLTSYFGSVAALSSRKIIMGGLPSGSRIVSVQAGVYEAAAGPGVESVTISLGFGNTGDPEAAAVQMNGTVPSMSYASFGHAPPGTMAQVVDMTAIATGANLSALTQGKVRVLVLYVAP